MWHTLIVIDTTNFCWWWWWWCRCIMMIVVMHRSCTPGSNVCCWLVLWTQCCPTSAVLNSSCDSAAHSIMMCDTSLFVVSVSVCGLSVCWRWVVGWWLELSGGRGSISASSEAGCKMWRCATRTEHRSDKSACCKRTDSLLRDVLKLCTAVGHAASE